MGAHFMDWIVIAVVGLLIFGPKALQGMARSAGRGMGQAKEMKDRLLSELPMDELMQMSSHFSKVPMNSQQALQMLLASDTPEKSRDIETTLVEVKPEPVAAVEVKPVALVQEGPIVVNHELKMVSDGTTHADDVHSL